MPLRLWPWASHSISIASSFEWDIKLEIPCTQVSMPGQAKIPQAGVNVYLLWTPLRQKHPKAELLGLHGT
jgi:hypothetical protein